jgi:hypothetical protein
MVVTTFIWGVVGAHIFGRELLYPPLLGGNSDISIDDRVGSGDQFEPRMKP